MESVRKAAEMVIEEVQIKGQFQMFSVYVCVCETLLDFTQDPSNIYVQR